MALLPVALAVAGCHHAKQVDVDSTLAPPPLASTSGRTVRPPSPPPREARRSTGTASGTSAEVTAKPLSAPGIEPHGRPLSTEIGLASWYGPPYHARQAADGSIYDQNAMTAAHRTLPMGTVVRVTNLATNDAVVVKITDRGPFVQGRLLDLSLAAAKAASVYRMGVARVKVEAFQPPERKPGADPAGRWCVQVGAFLDPDEAVQLKNDLSRRFANAKVIEFAGPTGHWVRINPIKADKSTASAIADSIHLPDADPYLVRLN